MSSRQNGLYEFGPFKVDAPQRLLTRNGEAVTLPPKTFDLLVLLAENKGRVLSKQELMQALWPDVFVEEANLSFQISALRKALGEEGGAWIDTLPKHGYRFTAPVTLADHGEPLALAAAVPTTVTRQRVPARIAVGVLLVSLAALSFVHFREKPPILAVQRYTLAVPEGSTVDSFAISPDGRYVVIAAAHWILRARQAQEGRRRRLSVPLAVRRSQNTRRILGPRQRDRVLPE